MMAFCLIFPCFHLYAQSPTVKDSFDSEFPTWEILAKDPFCDIQSQIRTSEQARSGCCESLSVLSPRRTQLFLGHTIAYPCLINDLKPTVWVMSNMPVTAALQIVLPHTLNPANDEPLTLLLPGTNVQKQGEWVQISFENLFSQFNQQITTLRMETGAEINPSRAYARRLVLFCQLQPGRNEILIDDLEVSGVARLDMDEVKIHERNPDFTPKNFGWFVLNHSEKDTLAPTFYQSFEPKEVQDVNWMHDKYSVEQAISILKPDEVTYVIPVGNGEPVRHQSQFGQSGETVQGQGSVVLGNPNVIMPQNHDPAAQALGLSVREIERRKALLQPLDQRISANMQLMIIDDLPKSIRAIEYQGEPLDFLAGLQFNAVWLSSVPSEAFLDEAWQIGLWVISPVPGVTELNNYNNRSQSTIAHLFRPTRNPILAWNIGSRLTATEHETTVALIEGLRFADSQRRCPVICNVESNSSLFSESVDILLLDNPPLFSSLDLLDYQQWLKIQTRLAKMKTTHWCAIQTQPSSLIWNQWRQFNLGDPASVAPVSLEQVRLQLHSGLGANNHGFLFRSQTPLTNQDIETQYRVAMLELVNWEMFLQDGWYSLGKMVAVVESSDPDLSAIITEAERSMLLLPMAVPRYGQYVMNETTKNDIHLLVPGSLETYSAQLLIPGGARPLYPKRVTGGIQIGMEEVGFGTPVFLAQSEMVLQGVLPRTRQPFLSQRAAELAIELAEMRLKNDKEVMEKFNRLRLTTGIPILPTDGQPIIDTSEQNSLLRETERSISTAKNLLRQKDFASAFLQAERSVRGLQHYEYSTWNRAMRNLLDNQIHPTAFPPAVSFASLPHYVSTVQRIATGKLGPNRLPGGDCENVAQWVQMGWERLEVPSQLQTLQGELQTIPYLTTSVAPSHEAAYTGNFGMQMSLRPQANLAENIAEGIQLESAPVWITTPPIPVLTGELICIHGYIRIPQKLTGMTDGLVIMDSLGGFPLALRYSDTGDQWRQFASYRIAPANGNMVVTFALSGIGDVYLDDLGVSTVVTALPETPPPAKEEGQTNSLIPNWLPRPF